LMDRHPSTPGCLSPLSLVAAAMLLPARSRRSASVHAQSESEKGRGQLPGVVEPARTIHARCRGSACCTSALWPGRRACVAACRPGHRAAHGASPHREHAPAARPVDRISRVQTCEHCANAVQGYGCRWRAQSSAPGRIGWWVRAWWSPAPCRATTRALPT